MKSISGILILAFCWDRLVSNARTLFFSHKVIHILILYFQVRCLYFVNNCERKNWQDQWTIFFLKIFLSRKWFHINLLFSLEIIYPSSIVIVKFLYLQLSIFTIILIKLIELMNWSSINIWEMWIDRDALWWHFRNHRNYHFSHLYYFTS